MVHPSGHLYWSWPSASAGHLGTEKRRPPCNLCSKNSRWFLLFLSVSKLGCRFICFSKIMITLFVLWRFPVVPVFPGSTQDDSNPSFSGSKTNSSRKPWIQRPPQRVTPEGEASMTGIGRICQIQNEKTTRTDKVKPGRASQFSQWFFVVTLWTCFFLEKDTPSFAKLFLRRNQGQNKTDCTEFCGRRTSAYGRSFSVWPNVPPSKGTWCQTSLATRSLKASQWYHTKTPFCSWDMPPYPRMTCMSILIQIHSILSPPRSHSSSFSCSGIS